MKLGDRALYLLTSLCCDPLFQYLLNIMSGDPVWGDEETFSVVLPPNGVFSEKLIRLAERVWSSTHLRSSIIEHLDRKSMLRFLTLDKTSFPEIVRVLYRAMHYTDYLAICQPHVTVSDLIMSGCHVDGDRILDENCTFKLYES
jgi:hypothetical protein